MGLNMEDLSHDLTTKIQRGGVNINAVKAAIEQTAAAVRCELSSGIVASIKNAFNSSPTPTPANSGDGGGKPGESNMAQNQADVGGGGKVICTELCRNGVIEHDVWMADIRYSRDNFSAQTMRGYHLWGIPYVKLMRQYPAFAKLAAYPTRWFAADIAYRMGVRSKPNYAGWAVRELAFRLICWALGIVAKARYWQSLWATPKASFFY